jgi:feruloyl-CoA synthase
VVEFSALSVAIEERESGVKILRSSQPLGAYDRCVTTWLQRWAAETPDHLFLAQREDDGWREISYAAAFDAVTRLGQALIDRQLSSERPLMILSGNGIDFALLSLAAMHVGVPVAPISPAYSTASQDFERIRHIAGLLTPGLVYAADADVFAGPLRLVAGGGAEVVTRRNASAEIATTPFRDLLEVDATAAVADAFEAVEPSTVAKILFTSGSTGAPKGVVNTHRMLCANQQALRQLWPFLEREPPVLVDWLPWHHTFGGNYCFNMVLSNGGTLYVDGGKPAPGLVEQTVQNLQDVSPTAYFNVPAGYQMLLPFLEENARLQASFFKRLRLVFYAAASLPQPVWDRLEALAAAHASQPVAFLSAWGATETAPMATQTPSPTRRAGAIGLPVPGTELKLCPVDDKTEVRVRGPNVTPGYWRQPELTEPAFDEEGFYHMGDAVRLASTDDPSQGLLFDGRIAEDFKLLTGVWVSVGRLRVAVLEACAPLVQDAVVAGHDRNELGLLLLVNPAGSRSVCEDVPADASLADVAAVPQIRAAIADRLESYNRTHATSSERIARAAFITQPLSIDRGELTDKGYINQRRVLTCRAGLVEQLYSDDPGVLIVGSGMHD